MCKPSGEAFPGSTLTVQFVRQHGTVLLVYAEYVGQLCRDGLIKKERVNFEVVA